MISQLTGTITTIKDHSIIMQVAGIGFDVAVASPSAFTSNKETTLFIFMDWNQENGPSLYGFANQEEKAVFSLITSCHGIGPKIALSMLQQMNPNQIIQAINSNDIKALSSVNGIGAKKAEQIVVHLKHKIEKLIKEGFEFKNNATISQWNDLSQALSA
jgi:Holliday junction DNA helicase RuvA